MFFITSEYSVYYLKELCLKEIHKIIVVILNISTPLWDKEIDSINMNPKLLQLAMLKYFLHIHKTSCWYNSWTYKYPETKIYQNWDLFNTTSLVRQKKWQTMRQWFVFLPWLTTDILNGANNVTAPLSFWLNSNYVRWD